MTQSCQIGGNISTESNSSEKLETNPKLLNFLSSFNFECASTLPKNKKKPKKTN